jgi:hypothetical protein
MRDKLSTLVDFPLHGLDLSAYVASAPTTAGNAAKGLLCITIVSCESVSCVAKSAFTLLVTHVRVCVCVCAYEVHQVAQE